MPTGMSHAGTIPITNRITGGLRTVCADVMAFARRAIFRPGVTTSGTGATGSGMRGITAGIISGTGECSCQGIAGQPVRAEPCSMPLRVNACA